MDFKSFSKKQKVTIIASVILILAIPLTAYLAKQTQIFKPRAANFTSATTTQPNTPQLFYADLEYDQTTHLVTQHRLGKTQGSVILLPEPPATTSGQLVYKIEVVSSQKELLQSGWVSTPKELLSTPNKTLRFKVIALYRPQAFVNIYFPYEDGVKNKIIWTGRME